MAAGIDRSAIAPPSSESFLSRRNHRGAVAIAAWCAAIDSNEEWPLLHIECVLFCTICVICMVCGMCMICAICMICAVCMICAMCMICLICVICRCSLQLCSIYLFLGMRSESGAQYVFRDGSQAIDLIKVSGNVLLFFFWFTFSDYLLFCFYIKNINCYQLVWVV